MPIKRYNNKKYVAKSTGKVWNTKEEAIKDNARYKNEPEYRMGIKAENYGIVYPTVSYPIPFIKSKKRTLTNAGLATGAVISENMLDTIAKHADKAGLPIKTALGLAVKESTLGNDTDDGTFHTLFKKDSAERKIYRNMYRLNGTIQHINKEEDVDERDFINYHDDRNPYDEAIKYAEKRASSYLGRNDYYDRYTQFIQEGEAYADKQAEKVRNAPKTHVLDAAFSRFKNNPNSYNPGQLNYPQLVQQRANEVWGSPEVQNWYKDYAKRRRLESRGKLTK